MLIKNVSLFVREGQKKDKSRKAVKDIIYSNAEKYSPKHLCMLKKFILSLFSTGFNSSLSLLTKCFTCFLNSPDIVKLWKNNNIFHRKFGYNYLAV